MPSLRPLLCGGYLCSPQRRLYPPFRRYSWAQWLLSGLWQFAVTYGLSKRRQTSPIRLPLQSPFASLIVFNLILILFIGLLSPPNNWDSMTYHMSRITHWMQNGSVAFYPTHIDRQNFLSPFAEYTILHLQILNRGSDWAAHSVQWLGLLVTGIAASGVVARLGFNKCSQSMAILMTLTTPMIILQGSSTQNDLLCAAWVISGVYFLLSERLVFAAVCTAVGALTRGTALLYLFPFYVFYLYQVLKKRQWKPFIVSCVFTGLILAVVNGPMWSRNFQTYRHPLGKPVCPEVS